MQDKKVVLIVEYFFMLYTFYDRAFYTHGAIAYFEKICFQLTAAAVRDVKKSIKTNHQTPKQTQLMRDILSSAAKLLDCKLSMTNAI